MTNLIGHWQQIEPNHWRWVRKVVVPLRARSFLPMPHVISDTMEPTEQVDGRFYTSKSKFRAVGRMLGLTEVGNENLKRKTKPRGFISPESRRARRQTFERAIAEYKAGRRPKGQPPWTQHR